MPPTEIAIGPKTYPVRTLLLPKKHSSAQCLDEVIYLRLPKRLKPSDQEAHAAILLERLAKQIRRRIVVTPPWHFAIKDGEVLTVWDTTYLLHVHPPGQSPHQRLRLKDRALHYRPPSDTFDPHEARRAIRRRLALYWQPNLERLVHEINSQTIRSIKLQTIRFKEQHSRWGSCSAKGNINISSRLLFLPSRLLQYVCLHELAHLHIPNHSDQFWQLVARLEPDYRPLRQQLRQYE